MRCLEIMVLRLIRPGETKFTKDGEKCITETLIIYARHYIWYVVADWNISDFICKNMVNNYILGISYKILTAHYVFCLQILYALHSVCSEYLRQKKMSAS